MLAIARKLRRTVPKFSLQQVLVGPFLIQILIATGSIGALSFYNGQRAVHSLARDLSSEVTSNIEQHLLRFANLPHTFLHITKAAIDTGQIDPTDLDALEDYFYRVVQLEVPVQTIYYGDESGHFVLVKQERDRALTYLLTEDTAPIRHIYELNARGKRGQLLQTAPYNPRERPWYEAAVKAAGPTWSPLYYFAAEPILGITPALPIYSGDGQLQGVLAIDITLSQINHFLQNLNIGENGRAFVMGRGGEVVASSIVTFNSLAPNEERVPFRVDNSGNLHLQEVGDYLLHRFGDYDAIQPFQELISLEGGKQFMQVTPLQDARGLDWFMVVTIPHSDLIGDVRNSIWDTFAIFLIAMAIAVLTGHWTARWIARPILRLSNAAREMTEGGPAALNRKVPRSTVKELEVLSSSFEGLAQQLLGNFDRLARSNEQLEQRVEERTTALRSAAQQMRAIFAAMTEVILTFDREGRYVGIAPTNPSLLIAPREELLGKRLQDFIEEPELSRYLGYIQTAIDRGKTTDFEYSLKLEDRTIWFAGRITPASKQTALWVARDITKRQQAQQALQQAEAKYRSIFEQALEGIFQIAPEGKLIGANPALAEMYGYSSPDDMMDSISNVTQQLYVDYPRRQELLVQLETQDAVETYEAEVRRPDGTTFWVSENLRAVKNKAGELLYYVGTVENITARKQVEEELRFHAFHDPLTGLPNRSLFTDRLGQVLERSRRRLNYSYAVLFLDLDRFKAVNDSLGHHIGDLLLQQTAQRLSQCVRTGDTVSRRGGDEFTVLLDDMGDATSALQTAEHILNSLAQPFTIGDRTIVATTSIGIAIGHPQYDNSTQILKDADTAMYCAKTAGRNCYKVFDGSLQPRPASAEKLTQHQESNLYRRDELS